MRKIVVTLLSLVLAAGMGAGIPAPTAAQAPEVLVIAQTQDMQTGDPHKTTLTHATNAYANIYDTLINKDAALNLRPGLAVSWQAIDPTTWEFKLRRGVKFHNGEPFNAHTVKYSFDRMLDPKTRWPGRGLFRLIKAVTVVDDATVRVTTERPWPLLSRFLGYYGRIVPPQYIARNGEEALARRPVGTGPYRFVRWVKDERVELQANPDFWGGPPRIGRVIIRTIPSESSRLAELLAGSVHLINIVPPEVFGPIQRSPRARLVPAQSTGIFFFLLNVVNTPRGRPLADKRVRQAANYALDRRAIVQSIMHNVGVPVATFCTEVMVGCDMSIPVFAHDPERARTLLREAGYADGFDMTISTTSGGYPGDRDISLAVADQLSRVGVRAQVVVSEYGVQLRQVIDRKLPQDAVFIRFTDFIGFAGGIPFRSFHSQGGYSLWGPASREFDQLLDAAEVAPDETRMKELYRGVQLLFREEAPGIPLFTAPNVYGMHRDLEWTPRPDLLLTMVDAAWRRR